MSNWEKNVRKVVPYVPGEQPHEADMIKLNTNENPYPPSPKAAEAIRRVAEEDTLRLYPDPTAAELVQAIADVYHVSPKQVFVGVGSDDVLAMAFMTYFNSDKPILFPDITYSFYDVWAEEFRIPYEQIPLDENFCIVPEQYFAENHPNGGIVFPNPNAPTGVELSLSAIESILQHNPDVVVIVDEAYVDFGAATAQPLLEKYENLLVVQTTSKSRSLAGMRIGYAIGNEKMISYLNDVKYSFNSYTMNQTTIAAGAAAIRDVEYFRKTVKKVVETREWSKEELAGQEVVFKVTLQSFKRAPELTDTWVAKNTDCKSVDDYKKEIRTTLEDEAKTSAQNTLRETAWNTVLSASEVKEYPQEDLDTAKTEFRSLYENYAKQGDMTLEDFVKAQGISMDDFEEQSGQYAEFKVKQNLIVQGIMDAENMTLEDKKSLSIQDELIKAYSVKDLAALVDKYGQAAVDESIGLLRVEDFILDNATVEEKVSAGDTQGVNGDDPSSDGSSAEGTVDEELEAAEATDMVPEDGEADQDADSSTSDAAGQE